MKYAVLFTVLISCSFSWAEEVVFEEGLKAFEETLYVGLRQRCTACHGDQGQEIGHSSSNVRHAYIEAKKLVDFSNPQNSRFAKMVKKKHWLVDDPNQVGMDESEVIGYIQQWWQRGENLVAQTPELKTVPVVIPEKLPTINEGRWEILSWDLAQARSDLRGCHAQVEVQKSSEASDSFMGSYRLQNPAFACVGKSLAIKGLYFSVSGQIAPYENTYASVQGVVPGTGVMTIVNPEKMILIQRGARDQLSLVVTKAQVDIQ